MHWLSEYLIDQPLPRNFVFRVLGNRWFFHVLLVAAIATAIASACTSDGDGTDRISNKLEIASTVIFLVLTLLQAFHTIVFAWIDISGKWLFLQMIVMSDDDTFQHQKSRTCLMNHSSRSTGYLFSYWSQCCSLFVKAFLRLQLPTGKSTITSTFGILWSSFPNSWQWFCILRLSWFLQRKSFIFLPVAYNNVKSFKI